MAIYTQAQLDAHRAAIAKGLTGYSVQFGSRMIRYKYRDLDDMLRVERIMAADVEGRSSLRSTLTQFNRD